jgi:hypothetical protein
MEDEILLRLEISCKEDMEEWSGNIKPCGTAYLEREFSRDFGARKLLGAGVCWVEHEDQLCWCSRYAGPPSAVAGK